MGNAVANLFGGHTSAVDDEYVPLKCPLVLLLHNRELMPIFSVWHPDVAAKADISDPSGTMPVATVVCGDTLYPVYHTRNVRALIAVLMARNDRPKLTLLLHVARDGPGDTVVPRHFIIERADHAAEVASHIARFYKVIEETDAVL